MTKKLIYMVVNQLWSNSGCYYKGISQPYHVGRDQDNIYSQPQNKW